MFLRIIKEIEDLFSPITCVNCGQEKDWLCNSCKKDIITFNEGFCYRCGAMNNDFSVCGKCRQALRGVYILGDYKNKVLKKIIWEFKYNFIKDLSFILAELLIKSFGNSLDGDYTIISVPLHKKRIKFRGFNQSDLIAKRISKLTGMEYREDALKRIKETKSQINLSRIRRIDNVSNSFTLNKDIKGKKIYLVDDVITTGSTIEERAKVLAEGGAKEVRGLVLARD